MRNINVFGLPIMAAGLFILLWCVREFYISGKGTLAPWSPPEHLVTTGLYKYSRNPMYIGVVTVICGWTVFSFSLLILLYFASLIFGFHLRIVLSKEPRLSKLFGNAWGSYSSSVPRWIPKINKSD